MCHGVLKFIDSNMSLLVPSKTFQTLDIIIVHAFTLNRKPRQKLEPFGVRKVFRGFLYYFFFLHKNFDNDLKVALFIKGSYSRL